jgi:hypothetical protein
MVEILHFVQDDIQTVLPEASLAIFFSPCRPYAFLGNIRFVSPKASAEDNV